MRATGDKGDTPRMGQPVAVIDLGEARRGPTAAAPYPWRARYSRHARRARRALPVLVCLLLLVALGGAAPPGYRLFPLFSVPVGSSDVYVLSGDTLYVMYQERVVAYRVPSGIRLWESAPTGRREALITPVPDAGIVLFAPVGGTGTPADPPAGILALDAGTGRVRWRDGQADMSLPLFGTRLAVLVHPDRLVAADLSSGRTVWQRSRLSDLVVPFGWRVWDGPPRIVFDAADGTTDVVDAVTGALVTRNRLPAKPAQAGTAVNPGFDGFPSWTQTIVGNRLVVSARQGSATVLDAYDLDTLAHRWRTRLDAGVFFTQDCRPVLCVEGPDAVTGVNLGTGGVLWRTDRWTQVRPLAGGRLLMSTSPTDPPAAVVDAGTLRPLLALDAGYPVGDAVWPDHALIAWRSDPVTTAFATVQAAGSAGSPASRPRVLARVPGVLPDTCSATSRYLVCAVVGDRLRFWRYR